MEVKYHRVQESEAERNDELPSKIRRFVVLTIDALRIIGSDRGCRLRGVAAKKWGQYVVAKVGSKARTLGCSHG